MASPDDLKGAPASTTGVASVAAPASILDRIRTKLGGAHLPPAGLPPAEDEDGGDDEGMLRMSFLEHLQELRTRILNSLVGIAVAFGLSLTFSKYLWRVVSEPAVAALTALGVHPPKLAAIEPMEQFNVIWFKLPILCAIFVASPWVLYQVWAFIAPGLYRRERKLAAPFVLCSAGLFILGGLFAYFVVFRYGLTFLMGIGIEDNVMPMVSISKYFDLFVNVTLGVGIVFELPVLIFFLTLLRIANPAFLLRHSRYAVLVLFVLAAIITPTPDVFNLMLFAVPMCLLFFIGIFASYLLVLRRENRRFPWGTLLTLISVVLLLLGGYVYLAVTKYGYHLAPHWPFLTR